MRFFFIYFAFLFVTCTCFECPKITWSDEFNNNDNKLNEDENWEVQEGDGCDLNLCGWGNSEWQTYERDNIQISNGTLKILANKEEQNRFTSARIRSKGKQDFLYGYFEARIRLPIGKGIWPAFWMMPTKSVYGSWPRSGEIDIMESIGKEHSTVHGTLHYSDDPSTGNHQYKTSHSNLWEHEKFSTDFHNFAVLKQPNSIAFYLDGSEYSKVTKKDVTHWPFEEEFHFIFNVAVGGDWPGYPDETTEFPKFMEVDYIRVFNSNDNNDRSSPVSTTTSTMFGNLHGPRRTEYQEKNAIYILQNGVEDYIYSDWTVPQGASFVRISNNSIAVDFDSASGYVRVSAYSPTCNITRNFSIAVSVNPPIAYDFTVVKATLGTRDEGAETGPPETEPTMTMHSTGIYEVVDNPLPKDATHPSSPVVKYKPKPMLYDNIAYSINAISDVNDYVFAKRRFFIDVYSNAPAGTEILIQLEDKNLATPINFPTGRHSRYRSRVPEIHKVGDNGSNVGGWKRVAFHFVDQPDSNVEKANSIILMFDPGYNTEYTWHFDDLDSYLVVEDGKDESS